MRWGLSRLVWSWRFEGYHGAFWAFWGTLGRPLWGLGVLALGVLGRGVAFGVHFWCQGVPLDAFGTQAVPRTALLSYRRPIYRQIWKVSLSTKNLSRRRNIKACCGHRRQMCSPRGSFSANSAILVQTWSKAQLGNRCWTYSAFGNSTSRLTETNLAQNTSQTRATQYS